MKNLLLLAAAICASQTFAGILPNKEEVLKVGTPSDDFSEQQMAEYNTALVEWEDFLTNLEAGEAVNLNMFSEYHRKYKRKPGASIGVDMEVNEIAIFYMEENMTTAFHWGINKPAGSAAANGTTGPLGNGLDYISHVFEIVSTEYRPKPQLPGLLGGGGIRIFAVRGRKPNEVELSEDVKEKLRNHFDGVDPIAPYINSLNTDYLSLVLKNQFSDEAPVWTEDIEITVMTTEDYQLNLYLQ